MTSPSLNSLVQTYIFHLAQLSATGTTHLEKLFPERSSLNKTTVFSYSSCGAVKRFWDCHIFSFGKFFKFQCLLQLLAVMWKQRGNNMEATEKFVPRFCFTSSANNGYNPVLSCCGILFTPVDHGGHYTTASTNSQQTLRFVYISSSISRHILGAIYLSLEVNSEECSQMIMFSSNLLNVNINLRQ